MPTTLEHEANAQRAAVEHLDRCYQALDGDDSVFIDAEHHPSAPFCGCTTCVVREVLESAWPHLLELARDEVRAIDGSDEARREHEHLRLLKGDEDATRSERT